MKTKVQRLAERMAALGHPVDVSSFQRTRAGRHQKASGGWAWSIGESRSSREYGSLWTVTELLKSPGLTIAQINPQCCISDWEVFPE